MAWIIQDERLYSLRIVPCHATFFGKVKSAVGANAPESVSQETCQEVFFNRPTLWRKLRALMARGWLYDRFNA